MPRKPYLSSIALLALVATCALIQIGAAGESQRPSRTEVVLLDPNSNALALVYREFLESGYSPEVASELAHDALGLNQEGQRCSAYETQIVYCLGTEKRVLRGWTHAICLEGPAGNNGLFSCHPVPCTGNNYVWFNLTVKAGCSDLPAPGTCISLHVIGGAVPVDCDEVEFDCDCFEETDPTLDCTRVEHPCCPGEYTGCLGCPNCG